MARRLFLFLCVVCVLRSVLPEAAPESTAPPARPEEASEAGEEDAPEGYYAFVESPNATPPRVRSPPYRKVDSDCPGGSETRPHVSAHNLCGDLNRGDIPRNPMGQAPGGEPYPFELLRNHTLRFLSRALPALRTDDSLPRVARLPRGTDEPSLERRKRAAEAAWLPAEHRGMEPADAPPAPLGAAAPPAGPTARDSRKFCDGGGVFCMLYRAINGDGSPALERREDPGAPPAATGPHTGPHPGPHVAPAAGGLRAATHAAAPTAHRFEGPPTPCPARVEYATPVFARNYQGVWRYVVQIPYEGYFTQTVEVTRCMQARCHYLEGGCLSSPRWVSLLVAELHYPPPSDHDQQDQPEYQQYLQKRVGTETTDKPTHCDGHDKFGCFQVRLYYDWFLVPGSCKCWRPDYFARYVRRRQNNEL